MTEQNYIKVLEILKGEYPKWQAPIVTLIAVTTKDPYKVLISTLLSLRTKDETTAKAAQRLFERAGEPLAMLRLHVSEIEKLIYPVGFYRNKAKQIVEISKILVEKYAGRVPDTLDELLCFNGVGRKTANLVLTEAYQIPAVCVDTHVHRISNRLGFVSTKTPEETEWAIREKLSEKHWLDVNYILVAFGQTLCNPVSPWCSKCPVFSLCERLNVNKSR